MKHLRALAVFCVTTFVMIASSHAEERVLPRTVKVLTIGNSFSENACKYLKEIGKDQGVEIIIGTANIGGCPLEKHARLARESDADPSLKPYTTKHDGKTTKINLQDALKAEEWDFVTIQQYSLHSYRPETYHPHVDELVGRIHSLAPQAKLLVHETWAYRPDSPSFKQEKLDQQTMYDGLRRCYEDVAREFNGTIIPVGTAFQKVRATPGQQVVVPDPKFDYKTAVAPNLPNQDHSLIVGWRWVEKDGKKTLSLDAKHANASGCYLGGLVWFEVLTGGDATKVKFVPKGVGAGDAELYRKVAHEVVLETRK
jgi:hypothetical protein